MNQKLITIHTPECVAKGHSLLTGVAGYDCCVGNPLMLDEAAPSRTVCFRLFPFDALTEGAKKVAIWRERQQQLPHVQAMAEAFAAQELKEGKIAYLDYPYKDVVNRLDKGEELFNSRPLIAMYSDHPDNYEEVVQVLAKEIPLSLSDEKLIEHIKADNLEFLADGTLWVYGDKEGVCVAALRI
jgi:hypothetical protein